MYRAYFIDDEPLVLEKLTASPMLMESGYMIAGCSCNPLTAAKEIEKIRPDVVFSDLKMPGQSGVELMEELRRSGYDGELVIISAYGEFEEARSFFKMDGFDYLVKPVSDNDLQSLLDKLSVRLAGKIDKSVQPIETPSPELNSIVEYLKNSVSVKHSLESIASKYEMNPNYICNLFARYLGTTFITYLTSARMEEAARLLRDTQKSIKEISGLCGYNDYFYFCRVFRETYACTPTAFREAIR